MTTTVLKREKERKRQQKQREKTELRRNKSIAKRESSQRGPATGDAATHASGVTDVLGHDHENPT
ncbi:MAG: hypothetical protein WA715_23120 [Candidatus Acidiferrum sp.]|jgi:hypothetical protein